MVERRREDEEEIKLHEKHELHAFRPWKRQEAQTLYYNVVPRLAIAQSKKEAWEIYKLAIAEFRQMLGQTGEEITKIDLLLLKRLMEKLKEFDEETKEHKVEISLTREEELEIEALDNKDASLIGIAKEFYGGVLLQMQKAKDKLEVSKIFDAGMAVISRIYEGKYRAYSDVVRWQTMLSNRYRDILNTKES